MEPDISSICLIITFLSQNVNTKDSQNKISDGFALFLCAILLHISQKNGTSLYLLLSEIPNVFIPERCFCSELCKTKISREPFQKQCHLVKALVGHFFLDRDIGIPISVHFFIFWMMQAFFSSTKRQIAICLKKRYTFIEVKLLGTENLPQTWA